MNFCKYRRWTGLSLFIVFFLLTSFDSDPVSEQYQTFSAASNLSSFVQTRRVNVPYIEFSENIPVSDRAIFWFGQITPNANYADVRMIYNDEALYVTLHVIDNRLWFSESPNSDLLRNWDAVSLYLNLDGNSGDFPGENSYLLVSQLNTSKDSGNYQAAYRGDGAGWVEIAPMFETNIGWRGSGYNNDSFTHGWNVQFEIPFEKLGLPEGPAEGSVWGLSINVHDRDDSVGSPIPDQKWPENSESMRPATWGQIHFGLPIYAPPLAARSHEIPIRQGLNGVLVKDGHVGGHTTCGEGLEPVFLNWGNANYAGYSQINIQNQWDISDWRCFSKYYITFPLDSLPVSKVIMSSTLTLSLFGNAGQNSEPIPQPSHIQVLTIAEDWDESALTWNNAPLALENVAGAWVKPLTSSDGSDMAWHWDVSRAVVEAYTAQVPLRLVLYSADSDYNSGKYFRSSDLGASIADRRPTLTVLLGDIVEPRAWLYLPTILNK